MTHHVLDIYGVHLHLATTKREWKQLRRQHDWLTSAPDSLGLAWFNTGTPPHLVLWVNVKGHDNLGDVIDTCAHEATHGASQILQHIGHDTRGTDEPHAYLVGWLTRWLYEGVRRQRSRRLGA